VLERLKLDDSNELTIEVIKTKRTKKLNLVLRPFFLPKLSAPENVERSCLREFLQSNLDWLKKKTAEIKAFEKKYLIIDSKETRSREIYRKEAQNYLPQRVKELSQEYSFEYKQIKIKNLKRRWGSCSSKNNLNFNLHLMRLPRELIDYVILHELVHTVEKNHGKKFWDLLEKVLPKALFLDKKLKKYKIWIS